MGARLNLRRRVTHRGQLADHRQGEGHGAARAVGIGVNAHLAPVEFHDALDDGQADPAARRLVRLQPDERLKDPLPVLGRNADAVVAHREPHPVLVAVCLDRDRWCHLRPGELQRVGQQVVEDLAQVGAMAGDGRHCQADRDPGTARLQFSRAGFQHVVDHRRRVHRLHGAGAGADPGHRQQALHPRFQLPGVLFDQGQPPRRRRGERGAVLLLQQRGEAAHAFAGRFEVVGEGFGPVFQLPQPRGQVLLLLVRLLVEPGIGDGQGRLLREPLRQAHVPASWAVIFLLQQQQHAEGGPLGQQRDRQRAVADEIAPAHLGAAVATQLMAHRWLAGVEGSHRDGELLPQHDGLV